MRYFFILLIAFPLFLQAQSGKSKPKHSFARGTLFGYFGYNRSWYSKSKINFIGPGYDFTLEGSKASDNPSHLGIVGYFNPNKMTIQQYNTRIGYYFKNHYAISFGYDHLKYVFADQNHVLLSGTINPGVDTVTDWSGTYNNEAVITDRNTFHYENANGLNYLRLELTRTDQWFKAGKNDLFAFSTNLGVGLGALLSYNDFVFAGKREEATVSMSGLGISAHAGFRFEFFRHVFLQTNFSGGFMDQIHVKNSLMDQNSYTKQKFGYGEFDAALGVLLYIRPTNDCNSCPHW